MREPKINLIVLRCSDIERTAEFYRALGLVFTRESHGGPEHYSTQIGDCVFELYPSSVGTHTSRGARIGFIVSNIDSLLSTISSRSGKIVHAATESPWGRRAVVEDPDGHRIELTESLEP